MQTLNEDIKNRTFKPVYLLWGEEAFLDTLRDVLEHL